MVDIVWMVALGIGIAVLARLVYQWAGRTLTAMSDADLDRAVQEAADWAEPNSLAEVELTTRRVAPTGVTSSRKAAVVPD